MDQMTEIWKGLIRNGFAVTNAGTLEEYKELCGQLGAVRQYADVRIDTSKKEYKYSSARIPFHTDNPDMKFIGFYCVESEDDGGDNLLLDARPLLDRMSAGERDALRSFEMRLPNGCARRPLLMGDSKPHIFYLPFFWVKFIEDDFSEIPLLKESRTGPGSDVSFLRASMLKFHTMVEDCFSEQRYINTSLKRGEALFLDNTYMLHGRQAIPPNSPRHLVRILIAKN